MDITKFWVEGAIKARYPDFGRKNGIDLNKDGRIEGPEVFAGGDAVDYQDYLDKNRKPLSAAIPFFKYGAELDVKNPIHHVLYLESDLHDTKLIQSAYTFLTEIVDAVRQNPHSDQAGMIYDIMEEGMNVVYVPQNNHSFVASLQKRHMDGYVSSLVAMAVGHEVGIRFSAVRAPHLVFLRGKKGDGSAYNMDCGESRPDDYYRRQLKIAPHLVLKKVYLAEHTMPQTEALFWERRGTVLSERGRLQDSLYAFGRALEKNPNAIEVHIGRAVVLARLEKWTDALAAFEKAFQIDSDSLEAHSARGVVLAKLGRRADALTAYGRVLALDPLHVNARYNRGLLYLKSDQLEEAREDFKFLTDRNPKDADAQQKLALVLKKIKQRESLRQTMK